MKTLKIGEFEVSLPIIQGGMGVGVSLAGLAAAVASAGGIGVISCVGLAMLATGQADSYLDANLQALRHEIRTAKGATAGVLGLNVMVALSDYETYVRAGIEEGIDIIFSGAGLPMQLPECVPVGSAVSLVPIVSSGRAADLICRKWQTRYGRLPDAVVVEGPLAGGHLGFHLEQLEDPAFRLECLIADTLAAVRKYEQAHGVEIPVIAAGGIYTGADILAFEKLGVDGVQMGTRFVTTTECEVAPAFKQAYLDAREEDLVIIKSPVGMPGRAIRNAFLDQVSGGKRQPVKCPYRCLRTCKMREAPYCIAKALLEARNGFLDQGFAFAGSNAYRTDEIIPVATLMAKLKAEYDAAVAADS